MGLGAWRAAVRRLESRAPLASVFDSLVPRLIALEPSAVVLFGSAHAGRRPVDRWTDLDLALVVQDVATQSRVRRRLRAAIRAVGEMVAFGWWGAQALALVRRDQELIGIDVLLITRAELANVSRTRVRVLFDPDRVLQGWRGPPRARPGAANDAIDVAIGLAWRARVRIARGDRTEADALLHSARSVLLPALRRASGARPSANPRGVERDLTPRWRRALSACRPRGLASAELLRAVHATLRLASRLGDGHRESATKSIAGERAASPWLRSILASS